MNEHYDGNFSSALRQLAQPVKLKLQALASSASADGVVGVVGIESLAPLHIVDNFIYERLNPSAAQNGPSSAAAAKSRKYNLYLNGCLLEHSMPIIRAINASSSASEIPIRTMSGSGRKSGGAPAHAYDSQHPIWTQIHTIHFEPRAEEAQGDEKEAVPERSRLIFLDYASTMNSACNIDCAQEIAGAASMFTSAV